MLRRWPSACRGWVVLMLQRRGAPVVVPRTWHAAPRTLDIGPALLPDVGAGQANRIADQSGHIVRHGPVRRIARWTAAIAQPSTDAALPASHRDSARPGAVPTPSDC